MSNLEIEPSYQPPVDQLLRLGEPKYGAFMDYGALGLTQEHVPELIRMVADHKLHNAPGESEWVWAPVHAWRMLGEFRAGAAVGPLLDLLRRIDDFDDDWIGEDVPMVLGQIGRAALEPVTAYLANANHKEWARVAAAHALAEIGRQQPELRDECVTRLSAQLEQFEEQTARLNAFLVSPLLDLEARESLPLMERAFKADCVDESVCGDYEDAEIEFGLKAAREHPRRPNSLTELSDRLRALDKENIFERALLDLPPLPSTTQFPLVKPPKTGRNDPCPCGSGRKFKKCCGQ